MAKMPWEDDPIVEQTQVTENPQQSTAMPWDSDPYAQEPESSTPPPDPGFGMRHNPEDGLKGMGYFGKLQMKDGSGNFATEMSGGINIGGKEMDVPLLVPTLTQEQIDHLLSGKPATDEIWDAAAAHAKDRLAKGLSVWHDTPQQSTVSLATDMSNVEDPSLPLPLRIAQRIAKPLFWDDGAVAEKGKDRGVIGNVAAGLYEGGQQIGAMVQRAAVLPERANETLDKSAAYEQELQKTDVGISGEIARTARGVLSSATTSVAGAAVGGAPGAIFFASGQEMNSAINEGKKAGLEGDALNRYVLRAGAIEAAPAAFMQAIGLPGAEGVIAKVFGKGVQEPVKRGILAALKQVGVGTAQEIPEELVTEIGHSVNTAMSGVDPNAVSPGSLFDTVYDTTLQTVGTMGLFSSPSIARGAVDTLTGKSRAQQADTAPAPAMSTEQAKQTPAGPPPDEDNVTSGINDIEAEVLFGEPAPVVQEVPVVEPVVAEEPPVADTSEVPEVVYDYDGRVVSDWIPESASEDEHREYRNKYGVYSFDDLATEVQEKIKSELREDGEEQDYSYSKNGGPPPGVIMKRGDYVFYKDLPDNQPSVSEVSPGITETLDRASTLLDRAQQPPQGVDVTTDDILAGKTVEDVAGSVAKPDITENTPDGYVQAKKRPDGKWQLFFTGTANEVFPGQQFKSSREARNYFKVQREKLKQPESTNVTNVPPEPVAAEAPVPETAPGEEPATDGLPVQLVSEPEQPGTQAETTRQSDAAGTVTPEPSPAKQSWEMTQGEAISYLGDETEENAIFAHRMDVQSALTDGKPVPDAVLADYPDLRDRVKLPTVEPVEQESPVMYGGKTGTDFVKDRWDNGKLGYRAGISLKEWGTKSGKMSKQAEKIAESKWDDLSPAAQRVIANRIQRDYPSVAVEPVAVEQPVQKPKRGKKQWTGFLPPQNQQTPAQQPTRKPPNVFDRDREIANKEYVLGELDKAIADAPDSAERDTVFIRKATIDEQASVGKIDSAYLSGLNSLEPAPEGYTNEYKDYGSSNGPGYYRVGPIPTVTIESPGGGKIKLVNSKSNISDYKRRVEKEFVTQVSRPTAKKSKLQQKPKGPTVPKLGTLSKESAAKVVKKIRDRADKNREEFQKPYNQDGTLVAFNGPVAAYMKGMATGKEAKKPEYGAYLDQTPEPVATVNTEELYQTVNQASKLAGRDTPTELYQNPDGTVGVRSVTKQYDEPAEYTYNVQAGSENLGIYNAGNLLDIIESARELGADTVALGKIPFNDNEGKPRTRLFFDGNGFRIVTQSWAQQELTADFPAYQKSITPAEAYAIRTATAKQLSSVPASADEIQSFMDTAGTGYTTEYLLDTPPPGLPDASTGRRMYAYAGIPLQDGDVIQAKINRDTKTVTFWQGATMQDVAHEILHVNITSATPAEQDALAARYGQDWERKEELIARDAADYYLVMREQGVLRRYYERIRDALRDLMRAMGLTRHPVSVEQFFRSVYTGRRARRMRYVGGERFHAAGQTQSGADIDSEYMSYVDNLDTTNAAAVIKRTAAQKGYEFAANLGVVRGTAGFTKLNTWGGAIYLSSTKQPENGGYYVDLGANPLTVDGDINDQTVANAQKQGYTSVTFSDGKYAVFDSAQIKSAATVTRDELGRIIPPSERFNVTNPDIRYAVKPRAVPKAPDIPESRMKARNDLDRDTIAKRIEKAGGVVKWMYRGLTDTDWYINESGEAGKLMFRLFDSRMNEAKTRTAETVVSLIRNLNTDQYNLASRYLSHADALESVTRAEQFTDPVEFNANMERFVFGWEETVAPMPVNATYEQFRKWRTSVIDQMKVYMGQLEAEIAEQPAVQEMLEKRRALVTDTQRRIVDRKLLPQNMLNKRNEYFHREIHMAGTIMEKHLGGVSQYAKQVRSFMKKRGTGVNALSAEFDPSSDYLLSEMAWLTDANMEIAKVDWWNDMERSFGYPIKALKSACREMNYTAYVGGPENRDRLRQIQKELNRIYESFIDPVTGKRVEKPEPWAAQIIAALHEEAAAIDGTWRSRKYMGYMLNKIKQEYTFEYDPFSDTDSDVNMFNELADILDDPAAPGLMKWYVAEIFKTMADVRGKIKTTLQTDPTKQYLTWQDNLPDGYDLVQPDEGHVMYPVMSVSAKALEHFAKAAQTVAHHAGATGIPLEDLVLSIPKGNTVYVPGGPKPQLVVPMDIADKINHGMKVKEKHWVARAFGDVTSKFQRWVLFNWATYPVYAIKNTVSDVENFVNGLALNPKQAMEFSGDMLRATKELRQYIYKKDFENISPELRAFRSSGGLGSNEMNSELLNQFDPTDTTAINKATNVLDYVFGYKYTQQLNAFRENLLRYAWYLNAKRNLETTGTMPHWGGSKSADIMQVMDKLGTHEAAALWANNQMLNYGNLTLFGQWLRDSKMGIFYSFTELSIRSVAQNVRSNFEYGNYLRNNIATTVRENPFLNVPVVRQIGLSASYAAQTAATLAMIAKMGAVWGAVALWNAVFFGDDDDELPEEYRYMPHLCVGRNADGSVRVLTNISMLGSVMEFLGVYEAAKMLTDTGLEKTDLGKMAKNMVMGGFVQRMVGHVNPYFKTGMELITGQSYFPDITHPRPKDRFDLLTGMFGLEDVGLGLKGAILADGTRARTHPMQRAMRVKQVDPLDEKRYEIYALYDAYRASVGKPDESNNFRGADRFLKNLRHAAKNNDPVAFRENVHSLWINRGMNQGKVTRSINDSLRYLDPMERVDKDDRQPFLEFLTPRQREAYQETVTYGRELRKKILQMYQTYGVMGPKK